MHASTGTWAPEVTSDGSHRSWEQSRLLGQLVASCVRNLASSVGGC